jgi:hypothetical protein
MSTTTRKRPQMSEEERAAYREQKRAEAEERMDTLLTADGFQSWLQLRRNVRTYSWANQVLIIAQALERGTNPTILKPAPVWKKDGYHPAAGSRAYHIWAFCSRRRKDGSWSCCGHTFGEKPRTCPDCGKQDHYFKLGPIFDAADVRSFETGEPPSVPEVLKGAPIEGDELEWLIAPLIEHAMREDWISDALLTAASERGELGSYNHQTRVLRVCATDEKGEPTSGNARLRVVLHELAHALGMSRKLDDALTYPDAEVGADCTAYVVAATVGLDTSADSIPYMAGWGGEDARAKMRALASRIDAIAKQLEDAILPLLENENEETNA